MLTDTFANRLQKALNMRNMKPVELAEKTGIDKSLISNYLAGNYKAKQDKLSIIAKALNVNPVWLMGYESPIEEDPYRNKYDKQVEKTAIQLGGQIIHIDKNAPLTAEDVIALNKTLLEIVEEQNKKNMK